MDKKELLKFIEDNFDNIQEYQFTATTKNKTIITMEGKLSWKDSPSSLKQFRWLKHHSKIDRGILASLTKGDASDLIECIKRGY